MNYSFVSDQIASFLSTKEIIRDVKSSSRLISLAIPCRENFQVHPDHFLKQFKTIFYFNKPAENYSYLAAGELVTINENGNGRFFALDKKIKMLKEKIITNWEQELPVPLFTGGMKFTVEHNDPEWKDFSDSNWIIPEIILLSNNGQKYIVCNFFFARTSDVSHITAYLGQKINALLENTGREMISPKINSSAGHTPKDKKKWKNMIARALEHINENKVSKIVLSRKIELILNGTPAFSRILNQLESKYPECGIFLFKNNSSVFFGATPEKLISFKGRNITLDALAGSSRAEEDSQLFSDKNMKEHDFVIEYIRNTISPFIEKAELTRYHNTKKLNNISHIWSEISAEVKDGLAAFLIIKDLFPTPAVCGTPKETAMNLIKKLEDHRRGMYAGLIGWFNFSDADFYVAIRSALCTGKKIIAYAGCGIVNGSVADDEFDETELKLIPILSLFKDENKIQPQYSLG